MNIINMTISGSILILITLIFRFFAINKLPKLTFLLFWYIAIAKLIVPISISTKFSIYNIFVSNNTKAFHNSSNLNGNTISNVGFAGAAFNQSHAAHTIFISPIFMIWFFGVVLISSFFIVSYFKCTNEFKTSLPINKNAFILNWKKHLKINRNLKIMVSDKILSPLSYGILKPVILLPKNIDWSNETNLNYVLEHELTHIKRFDGVLKIVLSAVLALHWFNPFVWIMYILSERDIELYCDETVVKKFGTPSRSAYAKSLISFEEIKSRPISILNHYTKNSIEERIVAIMKFKKTSLLGTVFALTLVASTATVFATTASNNSIPAAKILSSSSIPTATISQPAENTYPHREILKNLFETYTPEEYAQVISNVEKYSDAADSETIQHMKNMLEKLKADNRKGDFAIYKGFLIESRELEDGSMVSSSINPTMIMNPESVEDYTYTKAEYQEMIDSMKVTLDKAMKEGKITQEQKDAVITEMQLHLNSFK